MSNPQINTLASMGQLHFIENDILHILQNNPNLLPMCSHEILNHASNITINAINNAIIPGAGGYSIPASWIGSVAASMAQQNRIMQTLKQCSFNNSMDEAWFI